jgi:hypothetical protein
MERPSREAYSRPCFAIVSPKVAQRNGGRSVEQPRECFWFDHIAAQREGGHYGSADQEACKKLVHGTPGPPVVPRWMLPPRRGFVLLRRASTGDACVQGGRSETEVLHR